MSNTNTHQESRVALYSQIQKQKTRKDTLSQTERGAQNSNIITPHWERKNKKENIKKKK
jgi:hypothetical protein